LGAISEAKRLLDLAGVDHESLFPDNDGWLKRLEKDYFYAPEEIDDGAA